jgi:hypothetical protein
MRRNAVFCLSAIAAVLSVTACEQVKSATPLSPSIAGPIAGVEISSANTHYSRPRATASRSTNSRSR